MDSTKSGSAPFFSLDEKNPAGLKQTLGVFLRDTLLARLLRLFCRVRPVAHLPGTKTVLVTGFDSVQEVYSRNRDFEVPYEQRVEILRWHGFILALQDTPEYHDMFDNITRLWQPEDTAHVQSIARATTESILASTGPRLDLIQGLVKPVLMSIVEQHYGLTIPAGHVESFFGGNLAGSSFVFGGPKIKKKQVEIATDAIDAVWPLIDAGMAAAREHPDPTTVLGRYYSGGSPDPSFPEAKMRSALMTMIGGYLPTCTNASGRVMDVLLTRPDAMRFMKDAVAAEQDGIVLTGIQEALRLNFIIPLLWRRAAHDTFLGDGTTKHRAIPEGTNLAVSLQAGMYDRRRIKNPKRFDPDRSPTVRMIYGHEFHYCIGAHIANTVLVEIFKGLLRRDPTARRNPKNRWIGAYPWNLWLTLSEAGVAQ
jgi:cytochrome P450